MGRNNAWEDLAYRALATPWGPALDLFRFAGAWAPPPERVQSGWGAWDAEHLRGALLAERTDSSALLYGPVVVAPPDAPSEPALEVAVELLGWALRDVPAEGIDTLFTRPQGLDQIWVRHGFIPIPEALLPEVLRGRPGVGLFGWRGGTALWSAAGRGAPRARPLAPR